MAGTGQRRGRRGIIGGYWGGYSLLSLSPTHRALPGKVENLTPPANAKNGPDGAPPAGTVAPGSVPAPAARHRNGEQTPAAHDMHRDAPGAADRTASADRRPEQQRTTRRRPGLFLLPRLHPPAPCPACRISRPARAGRCRRCHDDHASTPQPQQIAPPAACTGKDQHRQRRTR